MTEEATMERLRELMKRHPEVTPLEMETATRVARQTITKIISGKTHTPQRTTLTILINFLEGLEADQAPGESIYRPGSGEPFKIKLGGVYGIDSIEFEGPADQEAEITRQALAFIRSLRDGSEA